MAGTQGAHERQTSQPCGAKGSDLRQSAPFNFFALSTALSDDVISSNHIRILCGMRQSGDLAVVLVDLKLDQQSHSHLLSASVFSCLLQSTKIVDLVESATPCQLIHILC